MFYATTCVRFGYGWLNDVLSGFSWESGYLRYPVVRGRPVLSSSTGGVDLPALPLSTLFNLLFRLQAEVSLLRLHIVRLVSNGMLTVSSIGCAVRLLLRARLTLIRLALIRNPWSFGERVSRSLYRYLYLHLLFRGLQRASRRVFDGVRNAPLPCRMTSIASVNGLCPIIIHARFLD